MKNLSDNWITEGWVDFEYKKYLLLAYLQHVDTQFREVKLYPPLADLIYHYSKLKNFSENKEQLKSAFPKMLQSPDFLKMKLNYRPLHDDDEVMKQLEEIVQYALPQMKKAIEDGRSIYDFLENEMQIEPIGISPLYQKEGYCFLSLEKSPDIFIYRYKINWFQDNVETFKGVMMQFMRSVKKSLFQTLENLKMELVKANKELPNPATFRIHSMQTIPVDESFLPISKRLLLKTVA